MKAYKILFLLLILSITVDANCATGFDYCMNIELPSSNNVTQPICAGFCPRSIVYSFTNLFDKNLTNLYNEPYVYQNASNVYIKITNSTDTINGATYVYAFNGMALVNNVGAQLVLTRITCLNGCSQIASKPYLTICLNGTAATYNPGPFPLFPDTSGREGIQLDINNFTQYYWRNWTFRDEITNQPYNFTGRNVTLTVWCNDYSQLTFNLSTQTTNSQLKYKTIQEPKNFLYNENLLPAIRQDSDHFLTDDYYIPSANGYNYTFTLVDYTPSQFYQGELKITDNINDTIGNILVQRFDQSNIQYVDLIPNHQYGFKVSNNGLVRDLGPVYLDSNTNRYVIVSAPVFSPFTSRWDSLSIDIQSNYSLSTITCAAVSTINTNLYFNIYYANQTPYLPYYSTSSSGSSITLSNTISDRSIQYYVQCMTNDTSYGLREKDSLINMHNETNYYSGLGNLTYPSTILNIDTTKFLNILSVVIGIIVAGLFSALSYGTGALVFAFTIVFFYYIGWFVTTYLMISLIVFLAIMLKMSEKRFGEVT